MARDITSKMRLWTAIHRAASWIAGLGVILGVVGHLGGLYGWGMTAAVMAASIALFAFLNTLSESRLDRLDDELHAAESARSA